MSSNVFFQRTLFAEGFIANGTRYSRALQVSRNVGFQRIMERKTTITPKAYKPPVVVVLDLRHYKQKSKVQVLCIRAK